MPSIQPVNAANTPEKSVPILEAVARKLGRVPNLISTIAHSPAGLKFYLGQAEALAGGMLAPTLREQIALTTAGINHCDYCASAHTLAGKGSGLQPEELAANLGGRSGDPRTQAALHFVNEIVTNKGHLSADALQAIRDAGYSDAEIVEVIAHVAMNIFTNYFNHIAATVIDFPLVSSTSS